MLPREFDQRLKHIGRTGGAARMGPIERLVGGAPPQTNGVRC